MKFISKDFSDRIGRFFSRNGHWVALGLCLTLMAGAAAWVGATELPTDKPPEYNIADGIDEDTPNGIAAGQAPDFVDRLNLSAATPTPIPILTRPIAGETITSFSSSAPVYNAALAQWAVHDAVDISGKEGAPVVAAAAGTVSMVADDPLWGTIIVVGGDDETVIRYAGLSSANVGQGNAVKAGDTLGALGTPPAEAAIGPHLHLEITRRGEPADPETLIAPLAK